MSRADMYRVVKDLEVQMKEAARNLQFEKAAQFRDEIFELRRLLALEEKTIGPAAFEPELEASRP
jgi:excinuclease ABC subunit B